MGGKTFSGKTSGALVDRASSRLRAEQRPGPRFLEHLLTGQRTANVEHWLKQISSQHQYLDNDQLTAHFNFYLQQLETLVPDQDSINQSTVNEFAHRVSWLIDNNIDQVCEQSAANIAAICAHLQPNSDYQEIFDQLDGFDQQFDTDQYHQYIEERIDSDRLDQATDRYLQEENDLELSWHLAREEIIQSIIFDPEFNGYIPLDSDDYQDWAANQRRQEVAQVLAQQGLPPWVYDSQAAVSNPQEILSLLTN